MRAPLKPRRPSPEEALAIATSTAPRQPPAQVPPASELVLGTPAHSAREPSTTLNLRVRMSTITALEAAAKNRSMTMKQVVAHALREAGVPIAEADLEDRTPRRKT